MTAPLTIERPQGTSGQDPDLIHIVCPRCFDPAKPPLIAFCGWDVTNEQQAPETEYFTPDDCAMCIQALEWHTPCPKCGHVSHA